MSLKSTRPQHSRKGPKKSAEDYDTVKLIQELKKIKELYPEKTDAIVNIQDSLPYLRLIEGMDGLLTSGFPEIAIATAGAD